MGTETTLVLWSGDPLQCVVAWGSAGLTVWFLVAALLGSALGILRSLEARPQRKAVARRPRPGTPQPRHTHQPASALA